MVRRHPNPPPRRSHDLHAKAQRLLGPVVSAFPFAVVASIEPQMQKARKPLLEEFHKRFYAIVAVEDVRRMDLRLESTSPWVSTSRWRLECPSPSCQSIEATLFTAYSSGCLDALAVDNAGGAGLWVAPQADRRPAAQCLVQPLPSAVDAPEAQVMVDGLPRRSKSCGSKGQVQPPRTT